MEHGKVEMFSQEKLFFDLVFPFRFPLAHIEFSFRAGSSEEQTADSAGDFPQVLFSTAGAEEDP